tara:strand:+ start:1439 stop:1657 length:219 start_codon:yes stop_codon:yes gene_type:complete
LSKKKRKKGGKLTENWIGTNADGDFFPAHHKKNREYKKIQSIADIPHQDLPDWKEGENSLGKLKNKKEKKNG